MTPNPCPVAGHSPVSFPPHEEEQLQRSVSWRPCLLILGQSCRAKGQLLNTLLGQDLLPIPRAATEELLPVPQATTKPLCGGDTMELLPISRSDADELLPVSGPGTKELLPISGAGTEELLPVPAADTEELLPVPRGDATELLPIPGVDTDELLPVPGAGTEELLPVPAADTEELLPIPGHDTTELLPVPKGGTEELLPVPKSDSEEPLPILRGDTKEPLPIPRGGSEERCRRRRVRLTHGARMRLSLVLPGQYELVQVLAAHSRHWDTIPEQDLQVPRDAKDPAQRVAELEVVLPHPLLKVRVAPGRALLRGVGSFLDCHCPQAVGSFGVGLSLYLGCGELWVALPAVPDL